MADTTSPRIHLCVDQIPEVKSPMPVLKLEFHARKHHNWSRAVRQTSSKPREDSESDTTPASPFGGTATRSIYRETQLNPFG